MLQNDDMEETRGHERFSLKHRKEEENIHNITVRRRAFINQGRIRVFISSVVIAIILFFTSKRQFSKNLPESYALCSPDGKIYTVDPSRSVTDCILVHGKFILETGSLAEVKRRWKDERTRIRNTSAPCPNVKLPVHYTERGSIIIPGMSDSHGHILELGQKLQLNLDGLDSAQEAVKRVSQYIKSQPDVWNDTSIWIDGGGWDHASWPGSKFPTSSDLDADPIIRGRPVVLLSKDGHASWCSSKAIQLSSPLPKSVQGGVIFRDAEGNLTGIFMDRAMDLIARPPWSDIRMLEYFTAAATEALSHGLTAVHDAGLTSLPVPFLEKLANEGHLPIRIYAMRFFNQSVPYWGGAVPKIIGHADERFTVRSVKIFMDGALRSAGAALYEPYSDNPQSRGFFRTPPELLRKIVPQFLRDGWQVNTHAIGDRANGLFLDLMEDVVKDVNTTALRPRLEHAQIIAPDDFSRVGKLGGAPWVPSIVQPWGLIHVVIASLQPSHVIDDMWFAEDRLGPERIKGTYAFRTLLNNSAAITLGSDFPVADLNPLAGFWAAITRLSLHGQSPHGPSGWFPEQRLTRHEALKGMTLDPAVASFTEHILGSLTPGKRADYVVLSKDILTVPVQEILHTKVLATALDGQVAYGKV